MVNAIKASVLAVVIVVGVGISVIGVTLSGVVIEEEERGRNEVEEEGAVRFNEFPVVVEGGRGLLEYPFDEDPYNVVVPAPAAAGDLLA